MPPTIFSSPDLTIADSSADVARFLIDQLDVLAHRILDRVARHSFRRGHRRPQFTQHRANVLIGGAFMTFDRRDHRSASAMPQHHHDPHAQMLDRVVEALDHHLVRDVAGHAHGEDVAEPAIENYLRRRARVASMPAPRRTDAVPWPLRCGVRASGWDAPVCRQRNACCRRVKVAVLAQEAWLPHGHLLSPRAPSRLTAR